jgi:hypothetical protein
MADASAGPIVTKNFWNSLEVVKVFISIVTPITIAILGCVIWNGQRDVVQRWEAEAKGRERIAEFRWRIYNEAAPLLNDIYTYPFHVGNWKELMPAGIIEKKRQLDLLMYSHEAVFSRAFFDLYRSFMKESFRSAGNFHDESRIRSRSACRRPAPNEDMAKWSTWFTGEDNRRAACIAYRNFLGQVSKELFLQVVNADETTDDQKISMCPPMYDLEKCP